MKSLGAGLKVGILTIIVVVLGFSMWKSVGERATGKDGFRLWAAFHDAQGLASKSRVVIAGLTIGEIVPDAPPAAEPAPADAPSTVEGDV